MHQMTKLVGIQNFGAKLSHENVLHLATFACRVEDLLDGTRDHALALQIIAFASQHRVGLATASLSVSKHSDLGIA